MAWEMQVMDEPPYERLGRRSAAAAASYSPTGRLPYSKLIDPWCRIEIEDSRKRMRKLREPSPQADGGKRGGKTQPKAKDGRR